MREEITTPPGGAGLPFQVKLSGISYCDGSYEIRRPLSRIYCMEYVLQGTGTVCEDGETFTASAGDIYLLHAGKSHHYYSDARDPWVKIWMNVCGSAAEHLIAAYGLEQVNHVSGLDLSADFKQFYRTATECRTAEDVSKKCSLLFHGILQKIAAHLQSGSPRSPLAEEIRLRIDRTPGFNVSLDELAEQLFFSKEHLIREFRKEYRVTPYEYALSRKLQLAKDLLINTNFSVSQIAARLDFCDSHYFTNFFRSRTGVSPRVYRANGTADKP